jgi:DNA-binding transcriptional regulator LsrR (DeoR family)
MSLKRVGSADEQAKIAAYLHASGLDGQAIARLLDTSEATVTRRLKLAKDKRYLSERPVAHLSEEDMQAFSLFRAEWELREWLLVHTKVRDITIAPIETSSNGKTERSSLHAVGVAAALRIWQHVLARRTESLGIAWGPTLQAVVRGVRQSAPVLAQQARPRIRAIPLFGDLLYPEKSESYEWAASTLAAELTGIFGGSRKEQVYLWLPAFVPWSALEGTTEEVEKDRDTVLSFLRQLPNYRLIYGPCDDGQAPLIDGVDTIVTGCGTVDDMGAWFHATGHLSQSEKSKVSQGGFIVGDLAGSFIVRKGAENEKFVEDINNRLVGLTLDHIKRCNARARENNKGGCLVVAAGERKAVIVRELVRQELATELILSYELASKLRELLTSEVG